MRVIWEMERALTYECNGRRRMKLQPRLFHTRLSCTSLAVLQLWPLMLMCFSWLVLPSAALSKDVQLLLDFKRNITNAEQTGLNGWKESDDSPCVWPGVTCSNGTFGVVTQLNVAGWGLKGTLAGASLGALANLTVLDVSRNQLEGSISPGLLNAKLLTHLDLAYNSFTGSIPANMSQLRSLTYLSISWNSLNGRIPVLDGLANLTRLYLDHNYNLTGGIPSLEGLKSIRALGLGHNNLTGGIPNLTSLQTLVYLDLGPNNLTRGIAPGLEGLYQLTQVTMPQAGLEGPLPDGIAGMPGLTYLDLSGNYLGGEILGSLWGEKELQWVDLSGNQLGGSIPRQLFERMQIYPYQSSTLNLSGNSLSGNIPDILTLPSAHQDWISILDLSNNQLNGSIPSFFGSHLVASGLLVLWLQNNRLSGDIGSVWSNLSTTSSLTDLRLGGNRFSGGIGPATIANWENLTVLDLSCNSQVEIVNESLSLILDTFTELKELRLSNIYRSGNLPKRGRTLRYVLEVLDLSHSHLEGQLSESIFADAQFLFANLTTLDLSGNLLTGQVPISISLMQSLTALNLSNNRLSGPLPPLPSTLLNASFFAGNPALCGPPLQPCRGSKNGLVLKLVAALIACVVLSACSCVLLVWRWRVYAVRHQQDVDLIAALQSTAHLMPLLDLRRATDNFSANFQIGVGGFGVVYKGMLRDGTTVAIKRSKRQGSQRDKDQFLNEVKILCQVHHKNLVRLLACCLENKIALLVFDYVSNGTLQQHLRGHADRLTWSQRLRIALQTADALSYLHECANPPIIHRDVKSSNILLDEHMNAKVADFGLSKLVPVDDRSHVSTQAIHGTFGYIDPEYYTSFQLSAKSDVYGFGVVLLEIISAQRPVDLRRGDDASLVTLARTLFGSGDIDSMIDCAMLGTFQSEAGKESIVGVLNLAIRCLEPRSRDRPTMREVWKELQALWLQLNVDFPSDIFTDSYETEVPIMLGSRRTASLADAEDVSVSQLSVSQLSIPQSNSRSRSSEPSSSQGFSSSN